VIDCHDREVNGFEFALRGRAMEAERARGSLSGALRHLAPCRLDAGGALEQWPDFSKPAFSRGLPRLSPTAGVRRAYTPEQNGLIERFFRSLKEECVWQHNFASFAEARSAITQWIEWYDAERPYWALGYRSPRQFRALQP
jgi:putative transposase